MFVGTVSENGYSLYWLLKRLLDVELHFHQSDYFEDPKLEVSIVIDLDKILVESICTVWTVYHYIHYSSFISSINMSIVLVILAFTFSKVFYVVIELKFPFLTVS